MVLQQDSLLRSVIHRHSELPQIKKDRLSTLVPCREDRISPLSPALSGGHSRPLGRFADWLALVLILSCLFPRRAGHCTSQRVESIRCIVHSSISVRKV